MPVKKPFAFVVKLEPSLFMAPKRTSLLHGILVRAVREMGIISCRHRVSLNPSRGMVVDVLQNKRTDSKQRVKTNGLPGC